MPYINSYSPEGPGVKFLSCPLPYWVSHLGFLWLIDKVCPDASVADKKITWVNRALNLEQSLIV